MLFAVHCRFRADAEARRDELHEQFNDHLRQPRIPIRLVGSLRDDHGGRTGILALIEAEDAAQLHRFLQASPYTQADLYERIEVDLLDIEVGSLG